jgi:hypothetical protein
MDVRQLVFICLFTCFFLFFILSCICFFAHVQVLNEHFSLVYAFLMILRAGSVHLYCWMMFFCDYFITFVSQGHVDHFQCFSCSLFAFLYIYRCFDLTSGTKYHCI